MDNFNDKRNNDNSDLEEFNNVNNHEPYADIDRPSAFPDGSRDEEFASEVTTDNVNQDIDQDAGMQVNSVIGWIALALSVISFFIMPIVLGIAGIIIGFVARARDAEWLGNTAIAIGIISILVRLFVYPFF